MPLARWLAMTSVLFSASLALAVEPRSTLQFACAVASDCDSTLRDDACCVGCRRHAGTRASVENRDAVCKAKPNAQCPPMDCPPADPAVDCVKGRCVLKADVAPPQKK